jgi:hypothetical protein
MPIRKASRATLLAYFLQQKRIALKFDNTGVYVRNQGK